MAKNVTTNLTFACAEGCVLMDNIRRQVFHPVMLTLQTCLTGLTSPTQQYQTTMTKY